MHLAKWVLLYVLIALLERSVASWLHLECLSAGETGKESNGLGDGMAVHGSTFARNAIWWSGPTICEQDGKAEKNGPTERSSRVAGAGGRRRGAQGGAGAGQ